MNKLIAFIIFFALQCSCFKSSAQDQVIIDSLCRNLKLANNDTTRVNLLYELSKAYWYSYRDKSLDYGHQSLNLAEKIDYKKGIGFAYFTIGVAHVQNNNNPLSLKYTKMALNVGKKINNKLLIACAYQNLGVTYKSQYNNPEALKNLLASLKIAKEIGNKEIIYWSYNNISDIYYSTKNYKEILKYYLLNLKLAKEIGNKLDISSVYLNLGFLYTETGNYKEALNSLYTAKKLSEEVNDQSGVGSALCSIGDIYFVKKNYNEALTYYFNSLKIYEQIDDKYSISYCYMSIGEMYSKLNKIDDAYLYLNKAIGLSKEVGRLGLLNYSYKVLSAIDSAQGNYKEALEHHKLHIFYKDSIVNSEKIEKTTQQFMQNEFDKKEAINKIKLDEKEFVHRLTRNILIVGLAAVLIFASVFFVQRNKISKGKKKSDELLLNILPSEVAEELKKTGNSKAKTFNMVSVMFTDFKDFTRISENVNAELLVDELHTCFSAFDNILHKYKVEKIKTIGDAYMCVSGLPVFNENHAKDLIMAAIEIMDYMKNRKKQKELKGEFSFELRIGINTGPVVAGIVGIKKFSYDIWGDTVNLAARMENSGEPGKINISGTTFELVNDKFICTHRGKILAKNKGEVDMYFVESVI